MMQKRGNIPARAKVLEQKKLKEIKYLIIVPSIRIRLLDASLHEDTGYSDTRVCMW